MAESLTKDHSPVVSFVKISKKELKLKEMLSYISQLSDRQENWGPKWAWFVEGCMTGYRQWGSQLQVSSNTDELLIFAEECNILSKISKNRVRASL